MSDKCIKACERTKACVGILSLDSFPPVLAEKHVRRQRAFRSVFCLFATLFLGGSLLLLGNV